MFKLDLQHSINRLPKKGGDMRGELKARRWNRKMSLSNYSTLRDDILAAKASNKEDNIDLRHFCTSYFERDRSHANERT
jgi:hypothetical protein